MPSFDIVCEVNIQEIDNAVNQATKEIFNRFDFRGSKSELDLDKEKKIIKIVADDEMKLRSIHQVLETKLAKRQVDCRVLNYGSEISGGGQTLKQEVTIKEGLEKEDAKKITKVIKDSKLKVTPQIQDQKIRVTGKKIDDLQSVIELLKTSDIRIPLQFINMRS